MTARMFARFRRRTLTRKFAIELWVVGLASAILLAIALALNGTADSAAETVGAAGVDGGRLARAENPELKNFMERVALASTSQPAAATTRLLSPPSSAANSGESVPALSRAAVAPRAGEAKAHAARVASALPPPRPALIASASPALAGAAAPAKVPPTPPADVAPWRLVKDTGAFAVANLVSVGNSLSSLAKKFSL